MSRRIFRVCRSIYANLDGEGARRAGVRWNSPGRPIVYMAETVSLAVLENLVHMTNVDFPTGYVVVAAVVPDHIRILSEEDLAADFRSVNQRQIGDRWIESCDSAVLEVRSTIMPIEHNYLLNPRHPGFGEVVIEPPVPFTFDQRLFGPR